MNGMEWNEWMCAIWFQSLGQPHECKLYSSSTENVYDYVQFLVNVYWMDGRVDTKQKIDIELSCRICSTKMRTKKTMNGYGITFKVRPSVCVLGLAWVDETRKINIKIPFFFFFCGRHWANGMCAHCSLLRQGINRTQNAILFLCISSDKMWFHTCVLHNLSIKSQWYATETEYVPNAAETIPIARSWHTYGVLCVRACRSVCIPPPPRLSLSRHSKQY